MVIEVRDWLYTTCAFCTRVRPAILTALYFMILCLSLYGMILIVQWWDDKEPAIEFTPGEASNETAHPGEVVVFYQPVKKLRDCEGVIHRIVTGACGHFVVSEKHSTLKQGFEGRLTIPIQIPDEVIPGDCGFRVHARYVCNPFDLMLHRQVFESPVIPFTVTGYNQ